MERRDKSKAYPSPTPRLQIEGGRGEKQWQFLPGAAPSSSDGRLGLSPGRLAPGIGPLLLRDLPQRDLGSGIGRASVRSEHSCHSNPRASSPSPASLPHSSAFSFQGTRLCAGHQRISIAMSGLALRSATMCFLALSAYIRPGPGSFMLCDSVSGQISTSEGGSGWHCRRASPRSVLWRRRMGCVRRQ